MYKDRLQQAIFMVDLQLQAIRGSIMELKDKVVLKEAHTRQTLLEFSPLPMMATPRMAPCSWNANAEVFYPTQQLNDVLEYLSPIVNDELSFQPPPIPESYTTQECNEVSIHSVPHKEHYQVLQATLRIQAACRRCLCRRGLRIAWRETVFSLVSLDAESELWQRCRASRIGRSISMVPDADDVHIPFHSCLPILRAKWS